MKVAITYNSAADLYDDPNSFWERCGRKRLNDDQLNTEEFEQVRAANFKYIRESGIREVEAYVVCAIFSPAGNI